uniref:Reticulon-like protein n=1 Tax=Zea mays TaxID=4577 RepID=A0A804PB43_MAIZE
MSKAKLPHVDETDSSGDDDGPTIDKASSRVHKLLLGDRKGSQPGNALVPAACLNRLLSLNSFGSSVSDVLLWRNRNLSAGILAGATLVWF